MLIFTTHIYIFYSMLIMVIVKVINMITMVIIMVHDNTLYIILFLLCIHILYYPKFFII